MPTVAEPVTTAPQAVTAYLSVRDAARALDFYAKAFGATETLRLTEPGGKIGHAHIMIEGSTIMLADEYPDYGVVGPQTLGGSPVRIKLNVANVDEFVRKAVAAGATIERPIQDQFYGERAGQVSDPFGYTWIVATPIENVSGKEMQRRSRTCCEWASQRPVGLIPSARVSHGDALPRRR